jgi:hypothetical protein
MSSFRRTLEAAQVTYQLLAIFLAVVIASAVVIVLTRHVQATVAANTKIVHGTQETELQTQRITKENTARALAIAEQAVALLEKIRDDQLAGGGCLSRSAAAAPGSAYQAPAAGPSEGLHGAPGPGPDASGASVAGGPPGRSQGRGAAPSTVTPGAPPEGRVCWGQVDGAQLACRSRAQR